MNPEATQESLLARLEVAWRAGDPRSVAECFAIDGVCEWRVAGGRSARGARWPRSVGRGEVSGTIADLMKCAPATALEFVTSSYGSDKRIWAEWRLCGGQGRAGRHETAGVAILEVAADGIRRASVYADSKRMRSRLRRLR